MRGRTTALLSTLAAGLALAASAPASAQQSDRYVMEKSAEGYVRMDRQTGEMSICTERSGQLVCRMAADDRDAFESEVERLREAVDTLTARVDALEQKSADAGNLPSESEFEQGLSYMERFFRRFMGIVRDFDQGGQHDEPEPEAQRT